MRCDAIATICNLAVEHGPRRRVLGGLGAALLRVRVLERAELPRPHVRDLGGRVALRKEPRDAALQAAATQQPRRQSTRISRRSRPILTRQVHLRRPRSPSGAAAWTAVGSPRPASSSARRAAAGGRAARTRPHAARTCRDNAAHKYLVAQPLGSNRSRRDHRQHEPAARRAVGFSERARLLADHGGLRAIEHVVVAHAVPRVARARARGGTREVPRDELYVANQEWVPSPL